MTCRIDDRPETVSERLSAEGKDYAIVITQGGVVLGRVRRAALDDGGGKRIEEIMESGPTTIRADTTLDSIIERLEDRSVSSILVTHSDGRLVGSLSLAGARSRLEEYAEDKSEQPVNEGERCCMCKT